MGVGCEVVIVLELSFAEQQLLTSLLEQYDDIVRSDEGDDPVLERLFPVGYRDDMDAAAEFSRYTRSGLVDHKTSGAGIVTAGLTGGDTVTLDLETAERWLPVLTDLRLIVAERLGIVSDEDEPEGELAGVYHWLGWLQSYLIEAIEALA